VGILDKPATDRSARPLFWHYPNLYNQPPYSAVRLGQLKLIFWHLDQRFELFDLTKDIGEKDNLTSERPADVKRLAGLLSDHLRETEAFMLIHKDMGEPVPMPDQAFDS
jgi:hypothetical protein